MDNFSAPQFRQQFPAINSETIFLDSAATALKPLEMINATNDYYRLSGSSVYRGQSPESLKITRNYEQGRLSVAKLIHAMDEKNIIWTRGATESINLIAQSYFRNKLQPGDEIIVSEIEHHSNLLPWMILAQQTGAKLVKWAVNTDLTLDLATLKSCLNANSKIIAITQMSNVTGYQPDIKAITQLAHNVGAKVVVDGAQGVVHHPLNVTATDIDFYVFSAHKLYGPTGLGVCYGKAEHLEQMTPWHGGGKMLNKVNFDGFTPAPIPQRFEAGTPNIAGVIAFSAVLDWLKTQDLAQAETYTCSLISYAREQLALFDGLICYSAPQSPLLSFNFQDIHHSDLGLFLTEQKIALRYGQHCAQPLMDSLKISGCLRISAMPYNNKQDIDKFINSVKFALSILND
ncbi:MULTISPECIES: cysteine desulfurase CsdA [Providencia]|uniref:cysteine desulfurase n=1 Tax=Providencia rustigianii DSM 4541 TaxID=500637 RepID=D1P1E4_9GAMM|nr:MULTISPECIES: cysteine desulfurase CsdA [Providencia]EFB72730.1 cysteine desulfurase, catalytic subunit CsdA [Providencia rustigianii DSM 4541]MTC56699.1 cysteine desulfurase CsdA [Providencia rustigianii]SPY78647.1 Cysteine sulfinate desulfinase [Providencia rustigianii]SUC28297.1 Cysteine sulfinate desulfinase [Providencia rustigianii]